MGAKTTNFNFFKPALTDPADITELNNNWDRIDAELANAGTRIVSATSTDGVAYTAAVPYLTELYNGLEIVIIPNITSASNALTLNVNGLGAKNIRLPLSSNTSGMVTPSVDNFFVADKPVKIMYDANYGGTGTWKTVDKQKISAHDLYGEVPIVGGGTGATTAKDARLNLGAVNLRTRTVTLTPGGWSGTTQTVNVDGVTTDNNVFTTHAPSGYSTYRDYGVRLSAQGDGTITFECDETPNASITVNIAIFE